MNQYIEERENRHIPLPASHKIDTAFIKHQKMDIFDHQIVLQHYLNEGRLTDEQVNEILDRSNELLEKEANCVEIDDSAYIIGDIHGQLYDLKNILKKMEIPKYSAVFLGDYVDRGYFSLECYIYLLLLKMTYPGKIFLLRGNHESLDMTSYFTFKAEVTFKHTLEIYKKIIGSFRKLPLAAVVLKKAFCVHGGISPKLGDVSEINQVDRQVEPHQDGLICDLLWSDPSVGFTTSQDPQFKYNSKRRCSFSYNYAAVSKFLGKNNLDTIFRGHEVQYDGYFSYKTYKKDISSVYSIFSAPNYCDIYQNLGAIAFYNGDTVKFHSFEAAKHPYSNNNFIDVINQTMPYVCEKITEFYLDLLNFLQNKESTLSSESTSGIKDKEIADTENFANKMILLRLERENCCEFPVYKNKLSATTCRTSDDLEIDHKIAYQVDSDNETFKEETIMTEAVSIELSPSLTADVTKEISSSGLDNLLKNFTVRTGDDLEVEFSSDESCMMDNLVTDEE